MISLYLRPDKTQMVYAEVKKKRVIDVRMTKELPEAYSSFVLADENVGIQKLRKMFRSVGQTTKSRFEEVYVLLPDTMFSYISCFDPSSEAVLQTRIMQEMNVESLTDYFIVQPMEIKAPFPKPQKSIFVLKKKYVEMLAKAAQAENFSLVSVEPFSTAFIRGNQVWDRDYAMVEVFPDKSCIVTYSAVGGIFRTDAPHMDERTLASDVIAGETLMVKNYAAVKMIATKYFSSVSPDLKMILFTDNLQLHNMSFVKNNMYERKIKLPDFVNASIRSSDVYKWLAGIGTFLQGFDEDMVYPDKNASIVIGSSNLLPPNLQANARASYWTKMARKTLMGMAGILTTVVVAETAAMLYFGSIQIEPNLQSEANRAKDDITKVELALSAINKAKEENPEVVKAYERLMKSRPKNCNFTNLKLGNRNGSYNINYIMINAISRDQMVFNDYILNLQGESFFMNPVITSIRNNKDVLQADITMGKSMGSDPEK